MDQNMLNFWKNYENVINWGYSIVGVRKNTSSESTSSLETSFNTNTNVIEEKYEEDAYSSDGSDDIDLNYLEFFQKTLEHQEKIEKEKRKVDKEYGFCNSSSSENESVLTVSLEEIKPTELYGSNADEIVGLESNLLSEFTTFNLLKKPTIWPCIALNLVAPEPELHLNLNIGTEPSIVK
ncbi:Hypothetical protein CINCED_3A002813 [Cinara cedri]|uniref:Uncharacterized protein n=1 Tax=Cinara cedri TaxID=506608 RepID=A0A5E4NPR0_9HEMI|nr:Hypothetical protein CINCED_3A002813 [Cinara cedri]